MRKSQDIKFKNYRSGLVPIGGGVSLLLLAVMALCPVANTAYAYSDDAPDDSSNASEADSATPSTVSITFSPTSGSASVTPTTPEGTAARVAVKANVSIKNSGGYSVFLSSKTPGLVGQKTGETIAGITGAKVFDALEANTWGYALTESAELPGDAAYKAMAQGQGDMIKTGTERSVEYNFLLSFAAKIGNTKPADTYENEVTLSVVSSPMEISVLSEAIYMQDITTEICANSGVGDTRQLVDKRDGKKYWVAKLKDNNCWMTQNLDLDIPANGFPSGTTEVGSMSYQNSDMAAPWVAPTSGTTSVLTTSDAGAHTDSRSWDQGLYVLATPTAGTDCGSNSATAGLGSCSAAGFIDVSGYTASDDPEFTKNNGSPVNTTTQVYDAHYMVGNWYQWNAATAGTGATIRSVGSDGNVSSESDFTDATSSICPKGWRLPTSGRNGSNNYQNATSRAFSFKTLIANYNSAGLSATSIQANELVESPLFFVRSGYINQAGELNNAGFRAYYWPSTAYTTTTGAYYLNISTGVNANPSSNSDRRLGLSVRCLAR